MREATDALVKIVIVARDGPYIALFTSTAVADAILLVDRLMLSAGTPYVCGTVAEPDREGGRIVHAASSP